MTDVIHKIHLLLDWCDGVALSLHLPPPIIPTGARPDIPILVSEDSTMVMDTLSTDDKNASSHDQPVAEEMMKTILERHQEDEVDQGHCIVEEEPTLAPPLPLLSSPCYDTGFE